MNIELFKHVYFRLPILVRLLVTVLLVMILFGAIIHFIEPNQFPTIFDGIWWAVVTGATVGYGDYVPLSTAGRIVGIILILTGGGLITFYITQFAATTVQHENDLSHGKVAYKGTKHFILIGWNEKTRILIQRALKLDPKLEIVLIDQTLTSISYQHFPIHFIHGDPTDDYILQKANIRDAIRVIITADNHRNEKQADNYSILTTVAVRGNHPDIPILVEILSSNQIDNAIRAGASTILRPNDFMSTLLFHEIFHNKSNPFESIIQLLKTQKFKQIHVLEEYYHKSFLEVSTALHVKQYLVLGILRDNEWHMNPPPSTPLQEGDILITLVPWRH
ncbi:potassium channel family protein [Ornithinibacillus bavariensis]|uniref:Potassium channel protein n=1 Tax=Ornithinibacillus bavariensis TaxID=545502 RepID=A0A919X9P2_9BACI|nr:potassium channel family protein [Ornithinibacillus bavariensis]GIO28611.1 potassium channel protein [Ornithinibacillus bavariensis]HAM79317.1 potassium channel protein [Ornithinibacillus sp.]